jgi:hypothetical protein
VVIDELELIKDNRAIEQGRRAKARWSVNTLFEWFHEEPATWHLLEPASAQAGVTAVELFPDVRGHQRLPRNDDELVDRATALKDLQGSPVHFLSYDSAAVLRANLGGLVGHRLRDESPTGNGKELSRQC